MIVNSSCQSSNHHHRVKAKHKSPLSQSQSQSIQPSCSPTPPLLCIDRPVQGGGASFGRPEKEKRVFSIGRVKKKGEKPGRPMKTTRVFGSRWSCIIKESKTFFLFLFSGPSFYSSLLYGHARVAFHSTFRNCLSDLSLTRNFHPKTEHVRMAHDGPAKQWRAPNGGKQSKRK